jgi:stage V sporulation protein B
MQAHGHPTLPVINMFIGGVIKLTTTFILSRNPHIGIMGAPIGTIVGYFAIMTLNIITMRRCTQSRPAIMKQLMRPLVAAALMGILVLGFRIALVHVLGPDTSNLILTALPVLLGVAVYAFAALKLKAITREDCMLLPKGEKIADILHL